MTFDQEEALYDFIENAAEPFTLEALTAYIRSVDPKWSGRLALQAAAFINIKRLAFSYGTRQWISRRCCFEHTRFVIKPSRIEILNGILVPGHRCVPFANPALRPKDYTFFWGKDSIPFTTTEGEPEELYPYYGIWGEEYAPHYIALDNPENELAYSSAYNEGGEPAFVSISTLDMSAIYRETGFTPGDCFITTLQDWKKGIFELEKISKNLWQESDLELWASLADEGFKRSFNELGAGMSTEEQIAHAYFYGGRRMRDVPAYSLEEFLYEKTDRIEISPYGIETRFWFAGKEMPDAKSLIDGLYLADKTFIEEILYSKQIYASEFTMQAYVKDALFRGETDVESTLLRLVPPNIAKTLESRERNILADCIAEIFADLHPRYSLFTDQYIAPLRQKLTELHTAVVEFAAALSKNSVSASYLPQHTFIMLSQIQTHAVNLIEGLIEDEGLSSAELDAMNTGLDGILDTYEEIRSSVDDAFEAFRKNNLFLIKEGDKKRGRLLQLSIGGTDVWRRVIIPETSDLETVHHIIQKVFNWNEIFPYCFKLNTRLWDSDREINEFDLNLTIQKLCSQRIGGLIYEYGELWTIKIILLSSLEYEKDAVCVAGEKAAPPEKVNGPLRFRKDLFALHSGSLTELHEARKRLGENFDPDFFDINQCNRVLEKF